ncbi:MAG: tetratricopeptide repeat protein, partial [bacterium]
LNHAIQVSMEGEPEAAIEIFRRVASDEPELPTVHFMMASEYFKLGLFLKAAEEFTQTLRLDSNSRMARFHLARSYFHSGLSDKCEEAIKELLAQDPEDYSARHLLATLLAKRGNYRQALKEELAVLKIRSNYLPALNNLGSYYLEMEDPVKATQAFQNGIELAPHNALLRNNLALLYLKQGKYEEALEQARMATQLDPQDSLGHYYMGKAYAGNGLKDKAQRSFQQAQEMDPALVVPAL